MELEDLARELRARQTAIKTVVQAMFAHLATHSEAPAHFIGQIMDDADRAKRDGRAGTFRNGCPYGLFVPEMT